MESLRLKPIAFCGENPVMEFYVPGTETLAAAVSYWHSTYSPQGEGHALLVYLDPANAAALGQPTVAIYADNVPLARYLTDTLTSISTVGKGLVSKRLPSLKRVFTASRIRANTFGWLVIVSKP